MSRHRPFIVGASPQQAITIRVRDPIAVAKAKGGTAGALAASVIPETVAARLYDEMARQLGDQLKANGVDAEVRIVDASSISNLSAPIASNEGRIILLGIGIGSVGALLAKAAWRMLAGGRR